MGRDATGSDARASGSDGAGATVHGDGPAGDVDRSIHERRANQAIGWCRHRRQAGPAVGPWIVGLVLHEQPAGRRAGVRRRPPSPATSRSRHVSQRHPCRRISGRALTKLGKTGLPKELDEHLCAERVSQISVVGIDTDMCVLKTALDILRPGHRTHHLGRLLRQQVWARPASPVRPPIPGPCRTRSSRPARSRRSRGWRLAVHPGVLDR